MKRVLHLSYLWLFLVTGPALAQLPHLRVSALINWPDTVYNGQNAPLGALVENVGTSPYQGPLQIVLQTDSGTFSYLYYNQSTSVLILPGDSLVFSPPNGYIFDSTVFRPGNNVVVVWPHSTQAIQVDTLSETIYFIPNQFQGVNEPESITGLSIYPNPARDFAQILSPEIQLESVRIMNAMGLTVKQEKVVSEFKMILQLSDLPAGLYLLEITGKGRQRSTFRLIKQE